MFKKLLPHDEDFFVFFEDHAALVVKGAKGLLSFVPPEAVNTEAYRAIKLCEVEADQIARKCVEALHKTFITPIDRSEILRLIATMDDIIDLINDVGKFILLYKIKPLKKESVTLVNILIQATEYMQLAIKELRKKKRERALNSHFQKINELEHEGDIVFADALSRLFDEEKDPLMVIKYKEIFEYLEEAINKTDHVAHILEGIVLENE